MIPAGHTYVAVDTTGARLLACFPFGIEDSLGEAGVHDVNTITRNIQLSLEYCPPNHSSNSRFFGASQWAADNPHISRFGTIEWALRKEQGHPHAGPALARDIAVGGSVRKIPLVRLLLTSLANITRSIRLLFGAVNKDHRNSYAEAFSRIPVHYQQFFSTNAAPDVDNEDIFSYRTLLANLWTRPHRDTSDWKEGWAWIVPFGDFSGGDFCVTELRRRIPFPAGAVLGLRGDALEHWTTRWTGNCRYSLVHTFHEYVRNWNWKSESSSEPTEKK
jgi:hypothetical protein